MTVWLAAAAAGPSLARFEPASGCLLGAFIDNDHHIGGDYAAFEAAVGRRHAMYLTYSGYGRPFPTEWVARVGRHGAAAHLGWEPNQGLDQVADDDYLRGWARAARASGVPIFLRFASEMNGNWMPYSGDSAKFVAKWRIVAQVMREEAPNVAMVWCVYATPRRTMADYYPGDDWVDWVGVNLYSVVYHNNDPLQPAQNEDPRTLVQYVYDRWAERKPMMIGEYAATSWCKVVGGPTVGFALDRMSLLYRSLPTRFPRIKAVCWFSWDTNHAGSADNNYSLFSDPLVTGAYRDLIRSDYFRERLPARPLGSPTRPVPAGTVRLGEPPPGGGPCPPLLPAAPVFRASAPAPARPPNAAELRAVAAAAELARSPFGLRDIKPGSVVTGPLALEVYHPDDWRPTMAIFRANGQSIHATNRAPFRYLWDPSGLPPGRYELTVTLFRGGHEPVTSPPLAVEVRRRLG